MAVRQSEAESGDSPKRGPNPLYMKCPTCGVKLHLESSRCWKCGGRYNKNKKTGEIVEPVIYRSENPDDAIFNTRLCDVDACMTCQRVQKNFPPCFYISCFGTGAGNCEKCLQNYGIRAECCRAKMGRRA